VDYFTVQRNPSALETPVVGVAPLLRNYLLKLEYDGTDYVGWQIQPNGQSIQAELEKALSQLLKRPAKVIGAGRTDAGVHAWGQAASFMTENNLPLHAYLKGLNSLLPHSIGVWKVQERELSFDARRSSQGKLYRYRIINRQCRSPLERRYAWEVFAPINEIAMQNAAGCLLGRHDFRAFQASGCEALTTVREIRRLEITRTGKIITVDIEATAFLRHMVRNIVGTLVEIGQGRRSQQSLAATLHSKNRQQAGPTAPAHGLSLVEVFYDPPPQEYETLAF
jgi:tRNA pseudouridine38-40 synthase